MKTKKIGVKSLKNEVLGEAAKSLRNCIETLKVKDETINILNNHIRILKENVIETKCRLDVSNQYLSESNLELEATERYCLLFVVLSIVSVLMNGVFIYLLLS